MFYILFFYLLLRHATHFNFSFLEILKGGDRQVRIFSAHNNWWATPEVSLPLPYQCSANVFLNFFATRSEDNVLL